MAVDPYTVLGIKKDASQDDIQKAYRRLAKKLHPDLNPGNKRAEEQFKEVSAAYDLLGDADKRARFDRGEIDASGVERRNIASIATSLIAAVPTTRTTPVLPTSPPTMIFSRRFSAATGRANIRMRGADVHYRLALDFLDAINGGKRQITLPDGSVLDVNIPPGTRDGQILRLRGKGRPGIRGGQPGDALVEIEVRPHRIFTRRGDDIHVDLPISLSEAVLGGKVKVPTPTGVVTMTVPKWSNTGTVLRLKGKGVPRLDGSKGDELVTLKVMLPEEPDPELEKFVAHWRGTYSPRQAMEV